MKKGLTGSFVLQTTTLRIMLIVHIYQFTHNFIESDLENK